MVAAIGAAAAIGGAAISASGAKSAANTQSAAADRASQLQAAAAAQQRQDLAPWTQAGGAAQTKLNQYLGIGGAGSGGVTSNGLATGLSRDQVRQQLLSQYTKATSSPSSSGPAQYANGQAAIDALGPLGAYNYYRDNGATNASLVGNGNATGPGYWGITGTDPQNPQWISMDQSQQAQGGGSTVDEDGLNAAIDKYYAEQAGLNSAAQSDPTYGSLLTPFHNGEEFDPGPAFSFTGEDLKTDPGYQFGLDQGTQGVERGQASRGNFLSGAAMKELDRYNQDYAGTKFNEGFNRAQSTYGTNLSARQNAWNTNLNAYDNNRSRVYSFLTGVSGMGQASAAGVASGNQQAANQIGSNMLAAGNAQAAGQVGSANALQSGINQATNGINSAGGWNTLLAGGNGSNTWGASNGSALTSTPSSDMNMSSYYTG